MSTEEPLFDLQTFVAKKYFSYSGRSKHTVDIYNDPSRLFPNNYVDSENAINKSIGAYSGRHALQKTIENSSPGPDGYRSLILPELDKSLGNAQQPKTPSPFNDLTKKYEENLQGGGKIKRPSRQPQMVFGKKLAARAEDLIRSLRSPKDIYKYNFQVLAKIDDHTNKQRKGKEEIKKIAKRYDVTVNLAEEGDFSKKTNFMKEIPMEYYRKLKETIQNKPKVPKAVRINPKVASSKDEILEYSMTSSQRQKHYVPPISLRSESEMTSPTNPTTQRTVKVKTRRSGSTALDMANREKSLFLSPLANALELSRFSSSFNHGNQPDSATTKNLQSVPVVETEENEEGVTPRIKTKKEHRKEQKLWIHKTNDIRHIITEYLADKTIDPSYIASCQEKVQKDVRKLEMSTEGNENEDFEGEGSIELEAYMEQFDVDAIVKDDMRRKPKVNRTIVKPKGRGAGNGNIDKQSFYKFLLSKEQRGAERTLAGMRNNKPKVSIYAGRELFPRIGDD